MRSVIFTLMMLSMVSALGCLTSATSNLNWSEDIAVFAESKDPKFHDHNIYSEGETGPLISVAKDEKSVEEADKYTQATLEWGKPQPIQKVVVKADVGELEFFEIQYQEEDGNWKTIRSVSDHVRDEYKVELREPVYSRKLRLKVPRQWDSRRMRGQKRRIRGEGGAPTHSYRKIRDIEVYYALPPEEAAASEESTTTQ